MEGHELQRDDAEDALQAIYCLGQLHGLVGTLGDLRVIAAADDDGPSLRMKTEDREKVTLEINTL